MSSLGIPPGDGNCNINEFWARQTVTVIHNEFPQKTLWTVNDLLPMVLDLNLFPTEPLLASIGNGRETVSRVPVAKVRLPGNFLVSMT